MRMKPIYVFIMSITLFLPSFVSASVVINEITWMGTAVSSTDEWIELYNNGFEAVDLTGWVLKAQDDAPMINLSGSIPGNSFFLLERTDDTTVPTIIADLIYTGALSNDGEVLILNNASGNEIDKVDASAGWPAGDNTTKETMQWNGSVWITAAATPRAINSGASESPQQQQTQPPSQPSSGGSDSSPYIPPEKLPKIKADAGPDKTVVVGASTEFRGQAFGLKDELLDNARFLWTFGDGAAKEGKNITHIYRYPGNYIVVLDITSGDYSAADRALIKATANQFFISEVKIGTEGWIEFENKSKQEIDISGCQIRTNGKVFTFPQSSRILSSAYLVVPSEVSGLVLSQEKDVIEFLYPGGFKADVFNYDGILKNGQSFNRNGELSLISSETPGDKNSSGVNTASSGINNSSSANKNPIPNPKEQKIVSEDLPEKWIEQSNKINTDVNAGAINLTSSNNNSKTYFIIAILAVILFGAAAILFIRRRNKSTNQSTFDIE